MRRIDARRNLEAIVSSAGEMLATNPRVSMQEIAAAAGLHRATVHRHFASRDDLVRAVLEQSHDEADAAVEQVLREGEHLAADERLERVVDVLLEVGDRWRTYRFAPGLAPSVRRRGALESPLQGLMTRSQAEGAVRTDVPADELTTALGGLVSAALPRIAEGSFTRERARAFVLAMLRA